MIPRGATELEPSGITLEPRGHPRRGGVPLTTRHRKYVDAGFNTPSRKVELYSTTLAEQGYDPLPTFDEPLTSPRSRPDLAERYPLVLTLREVAVLLRDPAPGRTERCARASGIRWSSCNCTSAARGIAAGDWVSIATPKGSVRRPAPSPTPTSTRRSRAASTGRREPCDELDLPGGHPAGAEGSANLNLVLSQTPSDPISGNSAAAGFHV